MSRAPINQRRGDSHGGIKGMPPPRPKAAPLPPPPAVSNAANPFAPAVPAFASTPSAHRNPFHPSAGGATVQKMHPFAPRTAAGAPAQTAASPIMPVATRGPAKPRPFILGATESRGARTTTEHELGQPTRGRAREQDAFEDARPPKFAAVPARQTRVSPIDRFQTGQNSSRYNEQMPGDDYRQPAAPPRFQQPRPIPHRQPIAPPSYMQPIAPQDLDEDPIDVDDFIQPRPAVDLAPPEQPAPDWSSPDLHLAPPRPRRPAPQPVPEPSPRRPVVPVVLFNKGLADAAPWSEVCAGLKVLPNARLRFCEVTPANPADVSVRPGSAAFICVASSDPAPEVLERIACAQTKYSSIHVLFPLVRGREQDLFRLQQNLVSRGIFAFPLPFRTPDEAVNHVAAVARASAAAQGLTPIDAFPVLGAPDMSDPKKWMPLLAALGGDRPLKEHECYILQDAFETLAGIAAASEAELVAASLDRKSARRVRRFFDEVVEDVGEVERDVGEVEMQM